MILEADHWSDVPPASWPWQNFSPEKMASHGDGSLILVRPAMDALQAVRDVLGEPMYINSAYRDPIYNAQIGGAALSQHKVGDAFDISLRGLERHDLHNLCMKIGFTGFGFYQTFLHVDLGRPRHWYGGNRSKALWTRS